MQGLDGFKGQAMAGARVLPSLSLANIPINATSGTGSVAALVNCIALIYVFGGGGGGAAGISATDPFGGGGGGGAGFRRVPLLAGQSLTYSVGAAGAEGAETNAGDGGNSTVTLPSGVVVTAYGGQGGRYTGAGGVGGFAANCDIQRKGGDGGAGTAGSGETATPGGGLGGVASGGGGAGGGAGFGDLATGLTGGDGDTGAGAQNPGGGGRGGSNGAANGTNGAAGKVVIVLVKEA